MKQNTIKKFDHFLTKYHDLISLITLVIVGTLLTFEVWGVI